MATFEQVDRQRQHCCRLAVTLTLCLALMTACGDRAAAQSTARPPSPFRSGTLASALLSMQGEGEVKRTAPERSDSPAVGARSPASARQPGAWATPQSAGTFPSAMQVPKPSSSAGSNAMSYGVESRSPGCPAVSAALREDARLHDVCFVDATCGWAVGDRGTIWHTEDGGRHWSLQASGVECSLFSVDFADRRTGCAVGGYAHPYTHAGSGVVLHTQDGGRTWKADTRSLLPILKKVHLADERRGWAVGCSSAACPSGLFLTEKGGRSWNPQPGPKGAGWTGGDFLDERVGALIAHDGAAAEIRSGRITPSATPRFGLRGLHAVQLVPPFYGWLVGDGGLAMLTRDSGHTWQTPAVPIPAATAAHFDFHDVSVRNTKLWIAGAPGTRIFHSHDAGLTWHVFNTRQKAPLRAIDFADDQRGWAVGDLGTILATEDGGQTWRRQRAGGTRAALMAIVANGRDLPLELFAKLSGNEGYLAVAEVVGREDPETSNGDEVIERDRVHQAIVAVGGCGAEQAWRFPLLPETLKLKPDTVIDHWDSVNDGYGSAMLSAHLVRQIRTYRPDVIVTHGASPTGEEPLGDLLNQAVLLAVEAAGDPTAHSDQITRGGLEPWTVTRVFETMPDGLTGTTDLSTAQLAPRLGRSLADAASAPRGLIDVKLQEPRETLGFRMLVDERPDHGGREDFFTGIVLNPGGEARRQLTDPPPGNLEQMQRMAQQRRNTRAILDQAGADSRLGLGMISQAEDLTRGLEDDMAASLLHHMARTYFVAGEWPLAATMFERLANRYPEHPLARSAMSWLVHYYASDEASWRVNGERRLSAQKTITRAVDPGKVASAVETAAWEADENAPFAVHQASAPMTDLGQSEERPQKAAALGETIQRLLPDLYADPAIGFPLAVAARKRGFPVQAERYLLALQRSPDKGDWWACAQGERWMSEPTGIPPKEVANCALAPTKPHLDGKFDDAVWQRAREISFSETVPQTPREVRPARRSRTDGQGRNKPEETTGTTAMLAYDSGYLYLAVRCRRERGVDYSGIHGIRPRDPDLSNRDRVELFLDLDRDYATYYRLTIDHRGFVGEGCWGDPSWNPTWFVASDEDREYWTVEAAIPLDQLTGTFPSRRSVWAIGLRRIIPGVGSQGWCATSVDEVHPEQFGYLIFD